VFAAVYKRGYMRMYTAGGVPRSAAGKDREPGIWGIVRRGAEGAGRGAGGHYGRICHGPRSLLGLTDVPARTPRRDCRVRHIRHDGDRSVQDRVRDACRQRHLRTASTPLQPDPAITAPRRAPPTVRRPTSRLCPATECAVRCAITGCVRRPPVRSGGAPASRRRVPVEWAARLPRRYCVQCRFCPKEPRLGCQGHDGSDPDHTRHRTPTGKFYLSGLNLRLNLL